MTTKTNTTTQLIHKSELHTLANHSKSPEIRRLSEAGLVYANRALPGDGRICRLYRRAIRAQIDSELRLLKRRDVFVNL